MTSETRYLCSSRATTRNGLLAFDLLTSNTSSSDSATEQTGIGADIGIRVFIRHSGATETEVTSGTPVAQVVFPTSTTYISTTWACPQTSMASTDTVVVRVYQGSGSTWTEMTDVSGYKVEFQTPVLGASQLNSATWTVVYYFYHVAHPASNNFEWGSSTYPSQIQNFSWTPAAAVSYIPQSMGDGYAWVYS